MNKFAGACVIILLLAASDAVVAASKTRSLGEGECSAYELGMSRAETRALQQVAFDQIAAQIKTPTPPDSTRKAAAPQRCKAGR